MPLSLGADPGACQAPGRGEPGGPEPRRNTRLLERLRQARQWIHQVCSDLSEAARLEQRTTPIAEWILDNEYVIEGNVRDVQQNLSRRFYQELPALANEPYRGLPRIYGLAKELVSSRGPAPGPGEYPRLCRGLSIRAHADDRRALGDPPDAAHRVDREHPGPRRPRPRPSCGIARSPTSGRTGSSPPTGEIPTSCSRSWRN